MSFEKQHQRGLEERAPCDQETEVEHNKDNRDAYASASASRSSRDASSSEAGTHAFSSASSPTNTQSGPAGGSPAARGMDQRRTPQDESNSTFHRSMQLSLMEPVGSMSLSPANRDVVLAARKGLFIVDLESPYDPPRFLAHLTTWEVADIQWNPHPARSAWVASTSNQKLLVWNLNRPANPRSAAPPHPSGSKLAPGSPPLSGSSSMGQGSAIEHVLHAHTRAITDINWSAHHPDILASCGIDTWIWVWDLRTPSRPAAGYSAWNAGATQVKWNRASPHRLASSCDNKVLIWDDRKGALPLATIEAHESKIYGLDWSRDTVLGADRLVTCSLDRTVKFWDLSSSDAQRAIGERSLLTRPETVIRTSTPVWRARHLPFGEGVMTLPQRSDTVLSMWARSQPESPVAKFEGHTDTVKEYLFRTRGGSDREHDDRRFQLITWSKDQTLRLWPISEETTKAVGHKPGAPVRVLMTRANAPDISYRTPPPPPPEDVPALSPSGVSSILPPAGAMRSLLNGRGGTGSGSRISEGSPYASSAATNWDGRPSSLSAHSYGRQRSLSESQRQPHSLLSHSAGGGGEGRSQSRSGMTAGQQSHHSVHHSLRPSSGMGSGGTSFSGVGRPLGASARNVQAPAVIRGGDSRSDRRGSAGFMTRGTGQAAALRMSRSHVGAPSDPIGWISGVRMQRDTTITSQGSQATRGRGGGKAIASGLPASETGRHSDLVEGHESTTAPLPESEELDEQPQNLGEEFMAVNRRLPRATFEKIEVAQRTCTISLYGPWADREPAFLRIAFAFPSDYPNAAPRYDLERNANVPLKARAFLLRNLAAIVAEYARRAQPSMEPCIRFLLGENLAQGSNVAPALDADESDDEDVPFQMLMPPRLSGASFGPNGELVVFAPAAVAQAAVRGTKPGAASRSSSLVRAGGARFLQSYSMLSTAMAGLARRAQEGGGGEYGVQDSDVLQLMSSDFIDRRIRSRADSKGAISAKGGSVDASEKRRRFSSGPFPIIAAVPDRASASSVHIVDSSLVFAADIADQLRVEREEIPDSGWRWEGPRGHRKDWTLDSDAHASIDESAAVTKTPKRSVASTGRMGLSRVWKYMG